MRRISKQVDQFPIERTSDWGGVKTTPKHLNPAPAEGAQWNNADPSSPHVQVGEDAGAYLLRDPKNKAWNGYSSGPQGAGFAGSYDHPDHAKAEMEKQLADPSLPGGKHRVNPGV